MTARLYLTISASTCIFLLACVALVNYLIDPAHIYKEGAYEKGAAEIILSGKNIANIINYDERLFQKYYISLSPEPKEVIMLGSSRAMSIDSNDFPGKSFFNHSVSGASLEDYIAIYGMYRRTGSVPKKLVISIDPWILNRFSGQDRWRSVKEHFFEVAHQSGMNSELQRGGSPSISGKILSLFSFDYLKESLSALVKEWREEGANRYYPTDEQTGKVTIKRSDGSRFQPLQDHSHIEGTAIEAGNAKPPYAFGGFTRLDENIMDAFTKFLDELDKDRVEIEVLLLPYHPTTYRILLERGYNIIHKAETFFSSTAEKRGIVFRGSYDASKTPCTPSEFDDGIHPDSGCVKKILHDPLTGAKKAAREER